MCYNITIKEKKDMLDIYTNKELVRISHPQTELEYVLLDRLDKELKLQEKLVADFKAVDPSYLGSDKYNDLLDHAVKKGLEKLFKVLELQKLEVGSVDTFLTAFSPCIEEIREVINQQSDLVDMINDFTESI